jgi:hypothetical protein
MRVWAGFAAVADGIGLVPAWPLSKSNIKEYTMKYRHALGLAFTISIIALWPGASALAADAHHHAEGGAGKLVLDEGRKWATDEPLRKNMAEIRETLANNHLAMHKGTLAADDYKALGTLIEARVATIIAECKLEPAADANLHLIVAALIAAADAMQGKSKTTPSRGGVQAVEAINRYGRFFNHPGWKPIA